LVNKEIEPPWIPELSKSNFDPEYTSLPLDFSELKVDNNNNGRR
jgi:hypothetical protein